MSPNLTMLQQLQEKKRQDALEKRNQASKERIQQLSSLSNQTSSWLNVKEELKGTIKTAKAILDPKYAEQEFRELLSHHDLVVTNELTSLYSNFVDSIDPVKKRAFNNFLEILLLKKHNTIVKQIERKDKPTVMFHEQEKQLEYIIRDDLNKMKQRVI